MTMIPSTKYFNAQLMVAIYIICKNVFANQCQDGFTLIGPCVDGSCPLNITCISNVCCTLPTLNQPFFESKINLTASGNSVPKARNIANGDTLTICADQVNDCKLSTNRCSDPRFAIRQWRQCRLSCRFCAITNYRQLLSELRIRQIVNGQLIPQLEAPRNTSELPQIEEDDSIENILHNYA